MRFFGFLCYSSLLIATGQDFQENLFYLFKIIAVRFADEVQAVRGQDIAPSWHSHMYSLSCSFAILDIQILSPDLLIKAESINLGIDFVQKPCYYRFGVDDLIMVA